MNLNSNATWRTCILEYGMRLSVRAAHSFFNCWCCNCLVSAHSLVALRLPLIVITHEGLLYCFFLAPHIAETFLQIHQALPDHALNRSGVMYLYVTYACKLGRIWGFSCVQLGVCESRLIWTHAPLHRALLPQSLVLTRQAFSWRTSLAV